MEQTPALGKAVVTVNFYHSTEGETVAQLCTPTLYKGDDEVLEYVSVPGTTASSMLDLLKQLTHRMILLQREGWKKRD